MKWFINVMLVGVGVGWLILPVAAQEINTSPDPNFQEQGAWLEVGDVQNAELSPDGNYLAVRTATHFLLYDIHPELTMPALIIEEEGFSTWYDNESLAFSADSQWVAAIFWINRATKTVRVWDVTTQEVVAEVTGEYYEVNDLAFSPTDPILLIARHWGLDPWMGQISVLDVEQGKIIREITDPNGYIHLHSISPDGEWVFIESANGTTDQPMILNLSSDTIKFIYGNVRCPCAISSNWDYASISDYFTHDPTYIVSLPSGETTDSTQRLEAFGGFTWNHDGSLVANLDENGHLQILDVQNDTLSTIGEDFLIDDETMLLFHPSENLLAFARPDNTIQLWNVEKSTLLTELSGCASTIYQWAFSPDGHRFAAFTGFGKVYVWDVGSGELIFSHQTSFLRDLAFNMDGTMLIGLPWWFENASASVKVWRLPEE